VIKVTLKGGTPPDATDNDPLSKAITAQATIGYYRMIIGFVANKWALVLANIGAKHPAQLTEQLLAMLWEYIYEQMWAVRNSISHLANSHVTIDKMAQMEEKLIWCKRH
jgi:hypothetical protein